MYIDVCRMYVTERCTQGSIGPSAYCPSNAPMCGRAIYPPGYLPALHRRPHYTSSLLLLHVSAPPLFTAVNLWVSLCSSPLLTSGCPSCCTSTLGVPPAVPQRWVSPLLFPEVKLPSLLLSPEVKLPSLLLLSGC